ncbi:hypothetical protein LCGC14_1778320 [marine sediment metagenome]|uniref:Methyltransferase type 11 domain-containing protein n=1 Tax=marine sediment metagenome TaxID=412755 RepID=A0A0F9HIQ3_9ZZZZ
MDIDPEGINFLDLGYGRTRYEEEMGEAPPEGRFFVDIDEDTGPDALWNLDEGIPLADSSIGGTINLGHIMAYLQNPEFVAQEVLRVAKPGTNVEIGTYISITDFIADAKIWGLTSDDIKYIEETIAEGKARMGWEAGPDEWAKNTYAFIDALSKGARLIERDWDGVYENGAHVFFTFQVV